MQPIVLIPIPKIDTKACIERNDTKWAARWILHATLNRFNAQWN